MKNFDKNKNSILDFLGDINLENLNVLDFVNIDDIHENIDFDEITDIIRDGDGFNVDIIYYTKAMEYLMDNDPSLKESLGLASDMGFTPENLNSETLASILANEKLAEEWEDKRSEIESFLESLEWD